MSVGASHTPEDSTQITSSFERVGPEVAIKAEIRTAPNPLRAGSRETLRRLRADLDSVASARRAAGLDSSA